MDSFDFVLVLRRYDRVLNSGLATVSETVLSGFESLVTHRVGLSLYGLRSSKILDLTYS